MEISSDDEWQYAQWTLDRHMDEYKRQFLHRDDAWREPTPIEASRTASPALRTPAPEHAHPFHAAVPAPAPPKVAAHPPVQVVEPAPPVVPAAKEPVSAPTEPARGRASPLTIPRGELRVSPAQPAVADRKPSPINVPVGRQTSPLIRPRMTETNQSPPERQDAAPVVNRTDALPSAPSSSLHVENTSAPGSRQPASPASQTPPVQRNASAATAPALTTTPSANPDYDSLRGEMGLRSLVRAGGGNTLAAINSSVVSPTVGPDPQAAIASLRADVAGLQQIISDQRHMNMGQSTQIGNLAALIEGKQQSMQTSVDKLEAFVTSVMATNKSQMAALDTKVANVLRLGEKMESAIDLITKLQERNRLLEMQVATLQTEMTPLKAAAAKASAAAAMADSPTVMRQTQIDLEPHSPERQAYRTYTRPLDEGYGRPVETREVMPPTYVSQGDIYYTGAGADPRVFGASSDKDAGWREWSSRPYDGSTTVVMDQTYDAGGYSDLQYGAHSAGKPTSDRKRRRYLPGGGTRLVSVSQGH